MDSEEQGIDGSIENPQTIEKMGSEYIDQVEEEHELEIELRKRAEREKQLQIVLQEKEREARNLTKRYNELKNRLCDIQHAGRANQTEVKLDANLYKEIRMLKEKVKEKNNRLELLGKELDNSSRSDLDSMYHSRFKNVEELQMYQKLSGENPHLESYLRSEHSKALGDRIQALKQLAEQLSYEIDRATAIKTELEADKSQFDSYVKKLRSEFKQLQDDNEKLVEEADRRRS